MPPWVKQAMTIRPNEELYLPMKLVRPHAYLEWLLRQPAGTWIMGFHIASNGKYDEEKLTVVIRMEPGPLGFVVIKSLSPAITNVGDLEDDMIKYKLPIRKGGFGNPSLHAEYRYALLMYSPVITDEDAQRIDSEIAKLNMAGHLSHVK
jgi:hypothetical protein